MACIDYGALLRKNGKLLNKDSDLFAKMSDTGYICDKAEDENGDIINIDGNYFVYAGDSKFFIVFYKGLYRVISNEKILYTGWNMPFNSETYYFDGLPSLKVSRLSKYYEIEHYKSLGTWKEFVKRNWIGTTGNEKLSELQNGHKKYKRFFRNLKKRSRDKGVRTRPYRFIAEWDYKGNHYEVIFGYGIDNNQKIWNEIKNIYGFREDEIKIIDEWFN